MADKLGASNLKNLKKFDGSTDYMLWAKKARPIVDLRKKDCRPPQKGYICFDVLDPSDQPEYTAAKTTRKRAKRRPLLHLVPANQWDGSYGGGAISAKGRKGDRQRASTVVWTALALKNNVHTREAHAYYKENSNFNTERGQDPEDFFLHGRGRAKAPRPHGGEYLG